MRLAVRVGMAAALLIILAVAGGYAWLRHSPYWAMVTLYSEDVRVENFRSMHEIFPSTKVPSAGPAWSFTHAPKDLPDTYSFESEERSLAAFLDNTETTGLIVIRDGAIAHEEYRLGAGESSLFTSFSVAKSVISALIGIALEEGHIGSVEDQITDYVPALKGSGYDGVTIEDALTMSSGVGFGEDYADPMSDVNRLAFSHASGRQMADILAGLERVREPGIYNDYISADTIALGLVLEAATGLPNETYLATRLWQPMGAEAPAFWSIAREGMVLPYCCLSATLRDYARFGRLFLEGGARDGRQIVPRPWTDVSTRPSAPRLEPGPNPASFWTFGYGYQWWVPEDPESEFLAIGIWGQFVYADRRRGVVIVKTSADEGFDTRDHETVAAFRAIARHIGSDSR